jgi:hypothetical protein
MVDTRIDLSFFFFKTEHAQPLLRSDAYAFARSDTRIDLSWYVIVMF